MNAPARFPTCGSLGAGLLVGLSIVVAALALTETVSAAWQTALVAGAPAILVLGIALQSLLIADRRPRS